MNHISTVPSEFAKALGEFSDARHSFKVAIVAPVHIQPSEQWVRALDALSNQAAIIIVDDSNGKVKLPEKWDVFNYERQRQELGEDLYAQFEMFHRSSACKTFGIWWAHKQGYDPIIVIDSDCIVPPDFIAKHLEALMRTGNGWSNPLEGTGFYSRGFPYGERNKPVWAHMGLWENELDLYGTDRVGVGYIPKQPPTTGRISPAAMFPLSGMNVSFRNDAAPYMLFLPNFKYTDTQRDWKFSRHDDIWGGFIFQLVAKAKGFVLSYGDPIVYHDTVVIPEEDAREEEAMINFEYRFYRFVEDALALPLWWGQETPTPTELYDELVEYLKDHSGYDDAECFTGLIPAFQFAANMFRPQENGL